MTRKHFFQSLIIFLVATFSLAAFGAQYSTGANDKEIKIGNTAPYSGPVAIYSFIPKLEAKYFKMINEKGGINGRKIVFISRDDGYNPANTVKQTRRLVENDKVLLMFNGVGTAAQLAVRPYLNRNKIPQLLIATGYSKFNNPKQYPYTVPGIGSYFDEGRAFAKLILKNNPNGKIGVLYQNDDFGKDLLAGLEKGLGDNAKKMIVMKQAYEVTSPTVDSQVINLKNSGANVFVNISTPRAAAQAIKKAYDINWKPTQYLSIVSTSKEIVFEPIGFDKAKGIISFYATKDITDPKYENDPDVKAYVAFMEKYAPDVLPESILNQVGYLYAWVLTEILKQAGDDLTRENIMKIATHLNIHPPLSLEGINFVITPTNYSPIGIYQPAVFDGKFWRTVGPRINLAD